MIMNMSIIYIIFFFLKTAGGQQTGLIIIVGRVKLKSLYGNKNNNVKK